MSEQPEKTLFLFSVLNRNVNFICTRNEAQKYVIAIAESFDFQTLNFVHNFCNSNSCYYSVKAADNGVLLTINFI